MVYLLIVFLHSELASAVLKAVTRRIKGVACGEYMVSMSGSLAFLSVLLPGLGMLRDEIVNSVTPDQMD